MRKQNDPKAENSRRASRASHEPRTRPSSERGRAVRTRSVSRGQSVLVHLAAASSARCSFKSPASRMADAQEWSTGRIWKVVRKREVLQRRTGWTRVRRTGKEEVQ